MRRRLFLALCILSGIPAWSFGVDFTPRVFEEQFANGATLKRTYFSDKTKKFTVSMDFDIELSGTRDEAIFRYRSLEGASLSVKNAAQPLAFAGDALEAFRPVAETFAPKGATPEGDWEETENPISRPGFQSFGLTRAYKLPGSTIRQSVTFLNAGPEQQFILITTAFATQFKEALERSQKLMGSWRELSEDDLNAPSFN